MIRRRSQLSHTIGMIGTLLALVPLWLGVPAAATNASAEDHTARFDYLYIVSNEGGSSGGHTAIRFGRDVYHFQAEDGLLVLRRESADEFYYTYALLGNRTIHSTRVAVSEQTFATLENRFRQRHRAQEAQIDMLGALRRDRRFLESFAEFGAEDEADVETPSVDPPANRGLPIPGLGYFEPLRLETTGAPSATEPSGALREARDAVRRAYGPEFLASRRRSIIQEMRALRDRDATGWQADPPTSVYQHPVFATAYSTRWHDLAAGLAAIDVLIAGQRLSSSAHHAPTGDDFHLEPQEILAFERYADQLLGRVVQLVDSKRADWGQTLLIAMARLSALNRSIETGRLVFLDSFPVDAEELGAGQLEQNPQIRSSMLLENQRQLDAARNYFAGNEDTREIAWERLEERSNRTFEIRRALQTGAAMRVARGHLVPSREAPYPLPLSPRGSNTRISESVALARERERNFSRALDRLHRYGLIDQNCATAIFDTINDSFGNSVELSQEQLGGHVRSRYSLAFIPFVSARQVNDRYTVVARETTPSYRQARIQAMQDQESPARVALRESNVFTSTAYIGNSSDSFFVFFTDGTPLLRPLFGAVNLTAALGQSVLGIVTSPIDHGANLLRGLRGAFVSLPELAFANIRKGSNDWIPREHRNLDAIALEIDSAR